MKKINLMKAKELVDELGAVEEYLRELKAEVDARKLSLHSFVGRTLVGDEFESSIYESQRRTLDAAKVANYLTEKQLARCYTKGEKFVTVTIKRIGEKKKETRAQLIKAAQKKVRAS
jgi:hypothetical protein